MWAGEKEQEELGQEKSRKKKTKWKQERAYHESKRIHLKALGQGRITEKCKNKSKDKAR